MTFAAWIPLLLAAWTLWAIFCAWLEAGPRPGLVGGLVYRSIQLYARLVHHLRIEGRELLPQSPGAGPLILVCNHTAGVDPILIQAACPFEPRWLMAQDMKTRRWGFAWDWIRVIFVDRAGRDAGGTREAIRHVREGGVLGIFPEGRIERPQRRLLPFQPGVGMIIRRTGADVLLVSIEGTPEMPTAWGSLWISSRAKVRFLERLSYAGTRLGAAEIGVDLRRRFAAATGWAMTDDALEPPEAADGGGAAPLVRERVKPLEPRREGRPESGRDTGAQRAAV